MTKQALRKIYRQKRNELSEQERSKMEDLMLIQFQTVSLPFLHVLLSYWPVEELSEPGTHLFTEFLRFRNPELIVAYPHVDLNKASISAIATGIDTPFKKSGMNIFEPQQGEPIPPETIDMVFVPMLAIDRNGYRIGYGKGFYDRYLGACREDCIKVGFSYFEPVDEITDKGGFDVPLDLCITPQAVYVF